LLLIREDSVEKHLRLVIRKDMMAAVFREDGNGPPRLTDNVKGVLEFNRRTVHEFNADGFAWEGQKAIRPLVDRLC